MMEQQINIFKLMKSKKSRKNAPDDKKPAFIHTLDPTLFKVKFDVSRERISCFISSKSFAPKNYRKTSKSSHKKQPNLPLKKPIKPNAKYIKQLMGSVHRDHSPDIVRQSSNSILQKIEENGINCAWAQNVAEKVEEEELFKNDDSLWSAFDSKLEKSFASTNDFPNYHLVTANYEWQMPKPVPASNSFEIGVEMIPFDWRTTLMIRNIPNKYTINEISEEIDQEHANTYDFLYLPCDLKNQCNVGYGFINFLNTDYLLSFYQKFERYIWKRYRSEKICVLTYARLQGLNELIEHFENSKVLNQKEKKFRPIIKYSDIHKMVLEQQRR